jgi:hypothetical protein
MEFWEFLIQKEGDRSWLPLESPDVEVLEGRYRIVARSSRSNAPVEIRVIHQATTQIPPVRRVQKRSGRTNKDGLIVIIPFTRLLSGEWEFRCNGDVMAEMMGEGWQHAVQLQVLPLEVDASDDWESHWQEDVTGAGITASDRDEAAIAAQDSLTEAGAVDPQVAAITSDSVPLVEPIAAHSLDDSVAIDDPSAADDPSMATVTDLLPLEAKSLVDEPSEVADSGSDVLHQAEPQLAEQLVTTTFEAAAAMSDGIDQPASGNFDRSRSARADRAVRLVLDRDTYMVIERGQSLTLTGRVEPTEDQGDRLPATEIHVRLYDPRNSQVLVDKLYPLAVQEPPFPFSCEIALPTDYQTYLILGELILYGAVADEPIAILATQSFSVTTDLHELLEAVANDFPEADLALPPEFLDSDSKENPDAPVAFPHLVAAPDVSLSFRPAQRSLPPQLRPSDPARTPIRSPQLPTFNGATSNGDTSPQEGADHPSALTGASLETHPQANHVAEAMDVAASPDAGSIDEAIAPPDLSAVDALTDVTEAIRLNVSESPSESRSAESLEPAPDLSLQPIPPLPASREADPAVDWDSMRHEILGWQRQTTRSSEASSSPEDIAFQALNLQDRFWARLQALAADEELSVWLRSFQASHSSELSSESSSGVSELSESSLATLEAAPDVTPDRQPERLIGLDAVLAAQEIVVDDEPLPKAAGRGSGANQQTPDASDLGLPDDEPIPKPWLEIPLGELVSGDEVNITIRLPNLLPRMVVKLWVIDRQSRSLLDGPRWLADFLPDGLGNLIAQTQLAVPYGCIEIQFEAIAIEMATQRESDKSTTTRHVIPPDLSSTLSLDQLDV